MKAGRLTKFYILAALFAGGLCPAAHAQKNLQQLLKNLLPAKASQHSVEQMLRQATRQSLEAVAFSKISNAGAVQSAAPLFAPNFALAALRPLKPAPAEVRRAVFTLQYSPDSRGKGSAFAVEIDGQVWGVTARHVLDDISRSPYISINNSRGKPIFIQVNSVREGNVHGADVAIFRIPSKLLVYITPLQPDYDLPPARTTAQSAGFSQGIFGWFNHVEVLFSSSHRILARYQDFPVRSGYCGSPFLVDGKAAGVFVGITPRDTSKTASWNTLFDGVFNTPINDFSQIVPIAWVRRLVKEAQNEPGPSGAPLKLLGNTLGILHPDEQVQAIQQLRGGRLVKTVDAYPFMDYNHLERFLDIGPEDVIRVVVQQGDRSSSRRRVFWYEWDVPTGALTRTEKK